MAPTFELPHWIQYAVAASSVIASLGVVIALIQIYITREQFKAQLAVTTNQFDLLNQGYLNIDVRTILYSPNLTPNSPLSPDAAYQSISMEAVIENTGNMPSVFYVEQSKIYFNGEEVFSLPVTTLGSSVSYPKQKSTYGLGTVNFAKDTTLFTSQQLKAFNITCKYKFVYRDFNSTHNKTVERTLVVHPDDYITRGTYQDIKDTL